MSAMGYLDYVGRFILIVGRTIAWARDPRLNKVEKANSVSIWLSLLAADTMWPAPSSSDLCNTLPWCTVAWFAFYFFGLYGWKKNSSVYKAIFSLSIPLGGCLFIFTFVRLSLYSPGQPQIHDSTASDSQVLWLQVYSITLSIFKIYVKLHLIRERSMLEIKLRALQKQSSALSTALAVFLFFQMT